MTLKVTTAAGAVASYSKDVAIEFAPPYQPAGTACAGAPGHVVLEPDQRLRQLRLQGRKHRAREVPRLRRNGHSVSDPAVVTSFTLTKTTAGTVVDYPNETPVSTTPDAAFRWDPSGQQWIFNLSTRALAGGRRTLLIALNDGSGIEFSFGLR